MMSTSGPLATCFCCISGSKTPPLISSWAIPTASTSPATRDIPLVRFGFPILDRVGHQYFPSVGYKGGLRLATTILSALLDRVDRDAPEESFELVF